VAEEIARLRSLDLEAIHQATTDNFFSLFTHAKRP
jgi:Tat protein secretion system quality control protein TatD with DNase activity